MVVAALSRCFKYNGLTLPDIPGLTIEQVKEVYAAQYPELLTAEAQVGEVVRGVQEVAFKRAVGTKG
ncbi:PRTRC system protein C [Schlegelella sp. ID0723]|uniref:PRTRC system protein C n=1 Tax=Piscinibacter koreensis TaxID=2742824 RepID=A0A7Y6NSS5_9BURK|nr:PRTRC system protein C [Rhodocyclales bacterium]NUZ08678.1 PRTRC system protein C [Schlegelella koreensis]